MTCRKPNRVANWSPGIAFALRMGTNGSSRVRPARITAAKSATAIRVSQAECKRAHSPGWQQSFSPRRGVEWWQQLATEPAAGKGQTYRAGQCEGQQLK